MNTLNNRNKTLCPSSNSVNSNYTKLLRLVKSVLKRTMNWNKYQSKVSTQTQNRYLDYLIDPRLQGLENFVLLFEKKHRHDSRCTEYFLPKR